MFATFGGAVFFLLFILVLPSSTPAVARGVASHIECMALRMPAQHVQAFLYSSSAPSVVISIAVTRPALACVTLPMPV